MTKHDASNAIREKLRQQQIERLKQLSPAEREAVTEQAKRLGHIYQHLWWGLEDIRDGVQMIEPSPSKNNLELAQVQAELRAISGTPMQSDADRLRRQALWQRLDALTGGGRPQTRQKVG